MDCPSENGVSTKEPKENDRVEEPESDPASSAAVCGTATNDDSTHLHANGDGTSEESVADVVRTPSPDSDSNNGTNGNAIAVDNGTPRPSTNGFPSVYPNQSTSSEAAVRHGYRSNVDADRVLYGNLQGATAAANESTANGRRRMTSKTNVYVSGLKPTDTQESLANLVHPRLAPKSVTVVSDKDGRSQGYGFLDFKSEEESRAAIEMIKNNNPKFVVRLANESEKDKTNLYLRGLPRNDTYDEEDLSAAFRGYGEVVSVKIMTERNPSPGNQQPRTGIGFVRFQNEEDARRALERINESKEHITIKGEKVNVEAKYADKQVGRIHSNHNAHPPVSAAGSNHHPMTGAPRPMPPAVAVHGNNLGWNLIPNNGQPLGAMYSSSLANGLFRNFHSMSAGMTGITPQSGLLWPNGATYLPPESWNESGLTAGVTNLNLSNNMGAMNSDQLPETTHASANAGQGSLPQTNQAHGNDPSTTMSHANLPGPNPVVLSRHHSASHPNNQVEWMNSHAQHHAQHGPEHVNGRGRHANTAPTPPQPQTPQTQNQTTGQAISMQAQQLGPNSNGFNPNAFFNANGIGYNHTQPNGFIPMVPAPVSIHQTEGGYQFTPGGCVFYGTPPIYSSSQMAQNGNGHVHPYNGNVGASQTTTGNLQNHSLNVLSYQQNHSALHWAALAANNGGNVAGIAAPQYYQAHHANGYQTVCPYPQSAAQGAGRLQHGNNIANGQPVAPQAPTPSSASGNGAGATAAAPQ